MDNIVAEIVDIVRPVSSEVFSGKSLLSLSTNCVQKLNEFTENMELTNSFNIVESSSSKANRLKDYQFVSTLFQKTTCLKIYPTVLNDMTNIKISRFVNIKSLEIIKIDINILVGLQKLRSQLQELTCCGSLQQISDLLMKCGGDNSQPYSWNELKKVKFSHNNIIKIDNSFDWTLTLHTLDISHNKLSSVDFINQLPNLKYLNMSYNQLTSIPHFKGPICNRLQIMVLSNNFIEDLEGLSSLINLVQLDLNQNSLIEHGELLSISHLISLQYLNLQSNPLSFHPNHRNLTSSFLNQNLSSVKFVLDGFPLSKSEKILVGSYHPVHQPLCSNELHNQEMNPLTISIQEKQRKIRNVEIEDKTEDGVKTLVPILTPSPSNEHLLLKKQVEQLREQYGELWLHKPSRSVVQDIFGFERNLLSSTPIEQSSDDFENNHCEHFVTSYETANNTCTIQTDTKNVTKADSFKTANESVINNSIQNEDYNSDSSDGEDVVKSGEKCIYLVTNKRDNIQVFVVVTSNFISERDVTNSKEKARWHVNTITRCEKDEECIVKLEFNTLRRDRKVRLYELDPSDIETFYTAVKEKIDLKKLDEEKKTYQCMKCSKIFKKNVENTLITITIACPACDSNLVIES